MHSMLEHTPSQLRTLILSSSIVKASCLLRLNRVRQTIWRPGHLKMINARKNSKEIVEMKSLSLSLDKTSYHGCDKRDDSAVSKATLNG